MIIFHPFKKFRGEGLPGVGVPRVRMGIGESFGLIEIVCILIMMLGTVQVSEIQDEVVG